MQTLPEIGFIRLPAVLDHVAVGRSTLWAMVKDGRFPSPVKLSPRVTAWRAGDIRAWIEAQGHKA